MSLEEALQHSRDLVAATDVPVSADSENLYADDVSDVAVIARQFAECGLAGISIEDFSGDPERGCYEVGVAAERVLAATDAAHGGDAHVVVTARAECLLYGGDVGEAISRLQAYQEAGADVLYAPGLVSMDDVASVVSSVDRPVNVLVRPGMASVAELAEAGVARISVGGGLYFGAIGGVVSAARELLEDGTFGYLATVAEGITAAKSAYP